MLNLFSQLSATYIVSVDAFPKHGKILMFTLDSVLSYNAISIAERVAKKFTFNVIVTKLPFLIAAQATKRGHNYDVTA